MLIINPIYDQAFKYMMDNEEIAKKVISIIIDKEVRSIQSKPQEVKTYDKKHNIPLSRFDFKAVIKNDNNKFVNVLIEIQKSNKPDPIVRFRRYLGKNYIRKETIIDEKGKEQTVVLPIITIYILGYNLAEYDTPALKVNNQLIDATTKKEIEHKNDFIQLLTHPSYILQIKRLKKDRKTKLEKFLAIFDQSKKVNNDYLLDVKEEYTNENDISAKESKEKKDLRQIKRYLNRATHDEEILLKLELEEDIENEFLKMEDELELAIKKKKEALEKIKEVVAKEKEAVAKEKEAVAKEKEAVAKEKETRKNLEELVKLLNEVGTDPKVISQKTNITIEEITKILSNI